MKYAAGCLFSAVMASLMTIWLTDSATPPTAFAQERGAERGPRLRRERPNGLAPNPRESLFGSEGLTPDEAVNVAVYEKNNHSVVNITTKVAEGFFLLDVASEGTGSGAVIDREGHVLTNFHVIEDAQEIGATLYDGKTYDAKLVGADPRNDIAILRINAPQEFLFPVDFGDSGKLKVGMKVFAIGNPFGLERTMTTGIISSLNRSLKVKDWTIKSIIQIDAAVNPGNSGGPLIDSHGRLIGINTAIASKTGQSAGVGFAIPINLVRRVVPQLIEHGRMIRPEIGIQRVFVIDGGLRIEQLTPGGPAERAGLRGPRVTRSRRGPFVVERIDRAAADVIVAVDGQEVTTGDDLLGYIESKKSGDSIELTIAREGRRMKVPVMLGSGEPILRR